MGANAGRLRLLDGALAAQDLAMVFPPKSPLRAPVDAALAAMQADGSLGKISARWFSPHLATAGGAPP